MARCQRIAEDLTAWVDDQLSGRQRTRVERHLATCDACRGEVAGLREAVARQTTLLRQSGIADVQLGPLWAGLTTSLESEAPTYRFFGVRSLAALSAAAGAALIVTIGALGGPEAVLVPIGAKHPPAKLQSKPTLFQEYPIIERLEILQNLDTVEAVPLDEEAPTDEG